MVLVLTKRSQTHWDDHNFVFIFAISLVAIFSILFVIESLPTAEALCGKTCRLAEEAGLTIAEYLDRGESGKVSTSKQQELWEDIQKHRIFIGIKISKTCQLSGTCPSYKELAEMYDNSDKYLSGDFIINNSTGLWERDEPQVYNVFEYYRPMNLPWIVFVDPDDYTWDRSKKIFIESSLRTTDSRDPFENQVRIERVGLDLNECDDATIGWTNNGEKILLDLLNHFYSNCRTSLEFDGRVEVFVESQIFKDCDRECFFFKGELKKELKLDYILMNEKWEKEHCDNEDENPYNDMTDYEVNKEECDRVQNLLDVEKESETEPSCYGIYCDDEDEDDDKGKSYTEIRSIRQAEIDEINECKEEQIWDEKRIKGKFRRTNFNCDDEDQRIEYLEILTCEKSYDVDVDCDDEDEREQHVKEMATEKKQEKKGNATSTG